jgi:hypothetical protein
MMQTFLNIAGLSISAASLAVAIFGPPKTKKALLFTSLVVLVVTITISLYSFIKHAREVDRVKGEIITTLKNEEIASDDLYFKIYPRIAPELFTEALYEGNEEHMIGHKQMSFQYEGRSMSVMVFYKM